MKGIIPLIGFGSMFASVIFIVVAFICILRRRKESAKKWAVSGGISAITFVSCLFIDAEQPSMIAFFALLGFIFVSGFFIVKWRPNSGNEQQHNTIKKQDSSNTGAT